VEARACGAVHPDGVVCLVPVFFETAAKTCASCGSMTTGEVVYQHQPPHESWNGDGVVTHRWEENSATTITVKDYPRDVYSRSPHMPPVVHQVAVQARFGS